MNDKEGPEWLALAIAEYQSLREESSQAREAQQAILPWSIGAIALVFAAGVSISDGNFSPKEIVPLLTFGFVLPGLVFGAALAWAGELIRMERVGLYLRGRERAFWSAGSQQQVAPPASIILQPAEYPLFWENFIASAEGRTQGKQTLAYLGAAGIYGGIMIFSLSVFVAGLVARDFSGHDCLWKTLGLAWASALLLVFLALFGYLGIRLVRVGRTAAGLGQEGADG